MPRTRLSLDSPYQAGPFAPYHAKRRAYEDRAFLRYENIKLRNELDYQERVRTGYYEKGPEPEGPLVVLNISKDYQPDPRRHPHGPHTKTLDHESNAERELRRQYEDARDRYKLNGMLRNVIELGLQYGVPKPFDFILNGMDYLGGYLSNRQSFHKQTPNGWSISGQCGTPRPDYFIDDWSSGGANNGKWARICLGGQATGQIGPPDPYPQTSDQEAIWGRFYYSDSLGTVRMQHLINYRSDAAKANNSIARYHAPGGPFPAMNPNFMRLVNPTPQPLPRPASTTARAPAVRHQALEVTVASGGAHLPPAAPSIKTARSSPPSTWTRENKSKGGKIAGKLADILDRISEGSEVIDAIYKALPKDVRKRWEKGRDLNRDFDQAGQYGVSGADWKVQAIFWNVTKIDVNTALRNILLNELTDKLYGAHYKAKNDLTGRGRKRPRRHF